MQVPNRPLKIKEACEFLGVSREKLRRMRKKGLVRAVDLNPDGTRPTWRIDVSPLMDTLGDLDMKERQLLLDFERRARLCLKS